MKSTCIEYAEIGMMDVDGDDENMMLMDRINGNDCGVDNRSYQIVFYFTCGTKISYLYQLSFGEIVVELLDSTDTLSDRVAVILTNHTPCNVVDGLHDKHIIQCNTLRRVVNNIKRYLRPSNILYSPRILYSVALLGLSYSKYE